MSTGPFSTGQHTIGSTPRERVAAAANKAAEAHDAKEQASVAEVLGSEEVKSVPAAMEWLLRNTSELQKRLDQLAESLGPVLKAGPKIGEGANGAEGEPGCGLAEAITRASLTVYEANRRVADLLKRLEL